MKTYIVIYEYGSHIYQDFGYDVVLVTPNFDDAFYRYRKPDNEQVKTSYMETWENENKIDTAYHNF